MNIGVILAAGDSKRFGGYMHKQYLKLNGVEVVGYSIKAMKVCDDIDEVLLVVDDEEFKAQYIANKYNVKCIQGGETRNISISNAIKFIKQNYDCSKVVFHDSVRPLVNASRFSDIICQLDEYDAVVTADEINDALVDNNYGGVKRTEYKLIQSPEGFRFDKLINFNANSDVLAIVSQVDSKKIKTVKSDVFNMKITYPEDLFIAEQLMRLNYYSVNHNELFLSADIPHKVLLLGGSGGIGLAIKEFLIQKNIDFKSPSHKDLDLKTITVDKLKDYCGNFVPDAIINAAAVYYDDNDGLSNTFDEIFAVNVKANEILIEYAKTLNQKINLVLLSSSSSTKGRENLTNYSAAKSALNSIVESQARVLATNDVYLNAVIPEKVNTPLIAKLHKTKINTRELLEPKDVINAIMYFAVAREHGRLVHIRKGL
ncbi:MAG: SDR family oxidoreductase [Clostridia bacterium]|nr:SDR family oxidoreductase [Clostridia bacterium]